jgi:DNA-directed RNA polymerase sigma subunit (sigma70/sigma32)
MTKRIKKALEIKDQILTALDANKRITTRDMTIIKRVLNGETYKSVGDDFGISRERVRCICFGTFRRKLKFEV